MERIFLENKKMVHETAIKANAAEARLMKQKVLKELKQRMEGLISRSKMTRLWISDLKELHNQVAEQSPRLPQPMKKSKQKNFSRRSNNHAGRSKGRP